jgi:hypothetical protein
MNATNNRTSAQALLFNGYDVTEQLRRINAWSSQQALLLYALERSLDNQVTQPEASTYSLYAKRLTHLHRQCVLFQLLNYGSERVPFLIQPSVNDAQHS